MYHHVENNDPSVGGSLLWSCSPANTMIPNHQISEEERILASRNKKLANRLGVCNAESSKSFCPSDIWKASREGNLDQLIYLLEVEKIPVNRTRWSGITAMHRAAEEGQCHIIECLLEHGADVNVKSSVGWYTPLHLACGRGHKEAGLMLLRAGARWEILDKHERTPIDWAIAGGYPEVARSIDSLFSTIEAEKAKQRKAAEDAEKAEAEAEELARNF